MYTESSLERDRDYSPQAVTASRLSPDIFDRYRSDNLTNNNVIRLPVKSTLVKETSTYLSAFTSNITPYPSPTTLLLTSTLPQTFASTPLSIVMGQSTNINLNIPASYIVGPPTVTSDAPKQLQSSFVSPSVLNVSGQQQEISNSMNRVASNSNLNHNYIGQEAVSRREYDRSVEECRGWQSRYNDLYSRFQNMAKEKSTMVEPSEVQYLRGENMRLEERISAVQDSQRNLQLSIESIVDNLVSKYKEQTLRECSLLMDRFRLECRTGDK